MRRFLLSSPDWPMVVTRILMGVMWLVALRWKLPPDFDGGGSRSLRDWVELEVAHPAFAWYGDLIDAVVLPNFTLFAWLVFLAELVVGAALVLGVALRPAAAVGLLMSFNLWLGAQDVPGEWSWTYVLMMAFHAAILVSPRVSQGAVRPEAGAPPFLPVTRPANLAAVILRVTLGVITLVTWRGNIQKDFYDGENFPGFFNWVFTPFDEGGNGSELGFVRDIVDNTLLAAPEFFGWVLTLLELGIGLGLLFGLFTRSASLLAIAFFGNLFLVYFGGHEWIFIYVMLTWAAVVTFFNWGGRTFGADQAIATRKGDSPATLVW